MGAPKGNKNGANSRRNRGPKFDVLSGWILKLERPLTLQEACDFALEIVKGEREVEVVRQVNLHNTLMGNGKIEGKVDQQKVMENRIWLEQKVFPQLLHRWRKHANRLTKKHSTGQFTWGQYLVRQGAAMMLSMLYGKIAFDGRCTAGCPDRRQVSMMSRRFAWIAGRGDPGKVYMAHWHDRGYEIGLDEGLAKLHKYELRHNNVQTC